jgi:hypothetical protein
VLYVLLAESLITATICAAGWDDDGNPCTTDPTYNVHMEFLDVFNRARRHDL